MGKGSLEMNTWIEDRVTVDEHTQCWNWNGSVNVWGYGRTQTQLTAERAAHRISWVLHNGAIPDGANVLHSCDNPRCCNPSHLRIGTQADNVRDMVNRGRLRVVRGSESGTSKLTEESVSEIRKSSTVSISDLARRYGVSRRAIRFVITRKTWRHVE